MSETDDRELGTLDGALLILLSIGIMVVLGIGMLQSTYSLYRPYAALLDWPDLAETLPAVMVFAVTKLRANPSPLPWPGWPKVPWLVLATLTFTASLVAYTVAATAILWAMDPALVTGTLGWIMAQGIGLVLTVLTAVGLSILTTRYVWSDRPWRECFKDSYFRKRTLTGIFLGLIALFAARYAATSLEAWLKHAYAVPESWALGDISIGLMILMLFVLTGPSDLRSGLKSALAALFVFVAFIAAQITAAATMLTLPSNSDVWLIGLDIILVAPIFAGAILLIAHRPGGWEADEPAITQQEAAS